VKRVFGYLFAAIILAWVGFVAFVYSAMRKPPEQFAALMAKLPGPAMLLFPFETMWGQARRGTVDVGDMAPDFTLPMLDRTGEVSLSSFRGKQPVVLVFGSYT